MMHKYTSAIYLSAILFFNVGSVHADEVICKLKGMSCQGCVDMIKSKICGASFTTCDIKVGEAHLVTRDQKKRVAVSELNQLIASTPYAVESCRSTSRPN